MAENDSLIAKLEREITDLRAENARRKTAQRKSAEEATEFRKQVEALTSERDTWKQKAEAAPSDLQTKIDELTGQIRLRDRRDEFAKTVGGQLADKATVEDLWQKAGYQPGETALTDAQITELVGKARTAAPYLFRPEGETPSVAAHANGFTNGISGGQGAPDKSGHRVTYKREDIMQPGWQQARPELVQALQAGTAVAVDK